MRRESRDGFRRPCDRVRLRSCNSSAARRGRRSLRPLLNSAAMHNDIFTATYSLGSVPPEPQTVARIQTTRSAGRFHLAGELARGLGASRRPSGGVRFTGSPAKCRAHHSNRRPAYPCLHRETATKQSTTKVSTLSQDLTEPALPSPA